MVRRTWSGLRAVAWCALVVAGTTWVSCSGSSRSPDPESEPDVTEPDEPASSSDWGVMVWGVDNWE